MIEERQPKVRGSHRLTVMIGLLAVIACGCQSSTHSTMIAEYRPRVGPMERPAPYSDVYQLWQWVPESSDQKKTDKSVSPVVRQVPRQVALGYAWRGSSVGFRRQNGTLIAIAGATTQPLTEAHYTWQTIPGSTPPRETPENDVAADEPSRAESVIGDFLSDLFDQMLSSLFNGDDDGDTDLGGGRDRHRRQHHPIDPSHPSTPRKKPTSQPA